MSNWTALAVPLLTLLWMASDVLPKIVIIIRENVTIPLKIYYSKGANLEPFSMS